MKLDAADAALNLASADVAISLDAGGLAVVLEARGIHAVGGGGPTRVDLALQRGELERLVRAGVYPGQDDLCADIACQLNILHETDDEKEILHAQAAIASALDTLDGWWLRSKGLRAVGQEVAARRVVATLRRVDAFLEENDDAFDVVMHLAEARCDTAADRMMTIWRLVAARAADDSLATAHRDPADQEDPVYRSSPKGAVVLVSGDGALTSIALDAYVRGDLDAAAREQIERCVRESIVEERRLDAHREAFAARELARTFAPAGAASRNDVSWSGEVPLLQYRRPARSAEPSDRIARVAASSPVRVPNAFSKDMSFAVEPSTDEHGDTYLALSAWLSGSPSACHFEIWVRAEASAAPKLHAVYPLRSDEHGRINCRLPLLPAADVDAFTLRLVRD